MQSAAMPAIPILTSFVIYFMMYLLLFISVLFKFADGCVDVYLFSILERNDECVLEFVRNATFAAQHLVVIG